MNIKERLDSLPSAPTVSQAADFAGVSKATFLRHEKTGKTTAESVVKIARAYNVNEVQSLINLGFVDEAAIMEVAIEKALGMAKNSQILAEMNKRHDPEARHLYRAEGKPGVIDLDDHRSPDPLSDASDMNDGTVAEFDHGEYAADSSDDEQALREERGEDLID
jgi:hypothetical protein